MTDDRQRLRREAVEEARLCGDRRCTLGHPAILAMESLLVEAETEIQSIWAKAHLLIDAETDRAEKAEARVRELESEIGELRQAYRLAREQLTRPLGAEKREEGT